jgi:F0F1-type ATP synthase assembly protein I
MSKNLTFALRIIYWQLLIGFLIALGFLILKNGFAGISSLLGTLTWIIPSFLFAFLLFRKTVLSPQALLLRFYFSEMTKLLFSLVLVISIASFLSINTLAFLVGFGLTATGSFVGFLIKP